MTEKRQFEKDSLLATYRQAGKITTLTGIKPSEMTQKMVKDDPDKQEAFLEGAQEGQRMREKEVVEEKED